MQGRGPEIFKGLSKLEYTLQTRKNRSRVSYAIANNFYTLFE